MRVLAIDPEFPYSFWSLGETLKSTGRKALTPPLGLLTVAALLPQEWEFHLADLNVGPLTEASWQWADLVMITGMIIQREGILRLVREAKERGKTVIVGAPVPALCPRMCWQPEPIFWCGARAKLPSRAWWRPWGKGSREG